MDFLKAEIERKRKNMAATKGAEEGIKQEESPAKIAPKWKTKRELENERLQKIREEEELERKRKEELALLKKKEEEEKYICRKSDAPAKHSTESTGTSKEDTQKLDSESNPTLPEAEVKRRLRALKEPVTLFGETRILREHRLRLLELKLELQGDDNEGQHNEFAQALQEAEISETKKHDIQATTTEEDDYDAYLANEATVKTKEDEIAIFLKNIFKAWEAELDARPAEVKRTAFGKAQLASMKQSQMWMKPFFDLMRTRRLSDDILPHVWAIVEHMKKKEYVLATRIYLTLAIGNAPWPMGVTMVGIHERSAREKIFSNSIAHVLNDETQRKYIQALKRLMTTHERLHL